MTPGIGHTLSLRRLGTNSPHAPFAKAQQAPRSAAFRRATMHSELSATKRIVSGIEPADAPRAPHQCLFHFGLLIATSTAVPLPFFLAPSTNSRCWDKTPEPSQESQACWAWRVGAKADLTGHLKCRQALRLLPRRPLIPSG